MRRSDKEVSAVLSLEQRALDMSIRVSLGLGSGVTAEQAYAELNEVAARGGEVGDLRQSALLPAAGELCLVSQLLQQIHERQNDFLDQLQEVRKQALESLRAEGHAVVVVPPEAIAHAFAARDFVETSVERLSSKFLEERREGALAPLSWDVPSPYSA